MFCWIGVWGYHSIDAPFPFGRHIPYCRDPSGAGWGCVRFMVVYEQLKGDETREHYHWSSRIKITKYWTYHPSLICAETDVHHFINRHLHIRLFVHRPSKSAQCCFTGSCITKSNDTDVKYASIFKVFAKFHLVSCAFLIGIWHFFRSDHMRAFVEYSIVVE